LFFSEEAVIVRIAESFGGCTYGAGTDDFIGETDDRVESGIRMASAADACTNGFQLGERNGFRRIGRRQRADRLQGNQCKNQEKTARA